MPLLAGRIPLLTSTDLGLVFAALLLPGSAARVVARSIAHEFANGSPGRTTIRGGYSYVPEPSDQNQWS